MKCFLTLLLGITAFAVSAANICVGPSATGNGSGTDWNDLKAFSGSPARGDVWYLVAGTYPGTTFTTAESGTTTCTVQKATIANHTDITTTGWSDSMAGQSSFSGAMVFRTSYFILDGINGAGFSVSPPDTTPGDYGFSFNNGQDGNVVGTVDEVKTDITLRHIYAKATSADTEKEFLQGPMGGGNHHVNNVTIEYCCLDGWQGAFMTRGQGANTYTGFTMSYDICLNGFSSSANHGEWVNPNEQALSGAVIRYCLFKGYGGSAGMTGTVVANNSANVGLQFYGNVVDGVRVGNGCITGTSQGQMNNAVVYNNTFLNFTSDSGPWINNPGSGNVADNNLVYNMPASPGSGGWTHDYNAFYSANSVPSESHGQTASGNPFNNSAGQNYTLTANTTPGTALGSPYNVDALGNIRTTWSRGAFEYGNANTNPVIAVTPMSLVIPGTNSNVTVTNSFRVQNTGGGTLAGVATVSTPFNIVSGGTYTLGSQQSQIVTISFNTSNTPPMGGGVANFSGGLGTTATITVVPLPPLGIHVQ